MTNFVQTDFSFVHADPHFVFNLPSGGGQCEGICLVHGGAWDIPTPLRARSEERRVGKEC